MFSLCGDPVSYLYDNSGALATVIDSQSGISTTYYYDFIDRLAKYTEKGTNYSHSVEYGFDSKNNLSAQKEIINGVSRVTGYTYDEDNRLDALTMEGHTVDYTYDALGRVVTQEVKNGAEVILTTTYTYYDPTETTTSAQVKSIQQTADNYSLTLSYTYDDNGNILTISDGANTLRYQYGEGNKLTREDDPEAGISTSYLYGENGNLFAELRRPYANSSGSTQTAYVEYGWDSDWGDMLTSYGELSLTYDNIGNMLFYNGYCYEWQHGRELRAISTPDTMWLFTYDANGLRLSQWNIQGNDYRYVYNGSQLAQMTRNGEVVDFFYDGEGRPAYFTYNNTTYYYVTNLQGDVIAILDSTGTMVVNYHYDAYGVLLQTGGTMATTLGTLNPLTYRGYVYDHETGLYYLQSRYYNPAIRQFINADAFVSTGQGILGYNMFAYCLNNPVCFADPTGTYSIYDTRAIFGGGGLGGPGAAYVTGVPSLSSIGGYVTSAAVSVKVVADVYNAINKQGEIPSSGCSIPSAPTPPKPDDDDDDDNLGETQEIGKTKGTSRPRGVGGKGWAGDRTWRENVSTVNKGGTITSLNGGIPTEEQATQLIKQAGGTKLRTDPGHDFPNPHNYPHINYLTSTGVKGTIRIFE